MPVYPKLRSALTTYSSNACTSISCPFQFTNKLGDKLLESFLLFAPNHEILADLSNLFNVPMIKYMATNRIQRLTSCKGVYSIPL